MISAKVDQLYHLTPKSVPTGSTTTNKVYKCHVDACVSISPSAPFICERSVSSSINYYHSHHGSFTWFKCHGDSRNTSSGVPVTIMILYNHHVDAFTSINSSVHIVIHDGASCLDGTVNLMNLLADSVILPYSVDRKSSS